MRIDPAILRGRGVASLSEGPKAVLPMQQIAPPPADCSEEAFQSAVIALATMNGWLHYHTRDSRKSAKGFPDLVLVKPERRVIFAELKSATGKVSDDQEVWIMALRRAGAVAAVWRPENWGVIVSALS